MGSDGGVHREALAPVDDEQVVQQQVEQLRLARRFAAAQRLTESADDDGLKETRRWEDDAACVSRKRGP